MGKVNKKYKKNVFINKKNFIFFFKEKFGKENGIKMTLYGTKN